MKVPLFHILGWLSLFLITSYSLAQNTEYGLPYVQNYSNDEYGYGTDSYTVLQGKNGLMYVGNVDGVLEFDGVNWRLIEMPNLGAIRSLEMDENGKVFVGGFGDFGFLAPDSIGFLQFQSLKHLLPESEPEFTNVYRILIDGSDTYFMTTSWLARLRSGKIKIWKPTETYFFLPHLVEGRVFVEEARLGVKELIDDELMPVENMSNFSSIRRITSIDGKLALVTFNQGIFITKDGDFQPLETEADSYLKEKWTITFHQLPSGFFAIGTVKGGLVLLDKDYRLLRTLKKENGIAHNTITGICTDDEGSIWLATYNGVSRVEFPAANTLFDERLGIDGGLQKVIRHNGELYAGGRSAILKYNALSSKFEQAGSLETQPFDFLIVDGELLAATENGVFNIGNSFVRLNKFKAACLTRSTIDPNIVYVGLTNGLAILKKVGSEWLDLGKVNGINTDIRKIIETETGRLWMQPQYNGVWSVDFSENNFLEASFRHFAANEDLPKGLLFLQEINNEIVFQINGVIYQYMEKLDSIVPIPDYGKQFDLQFGLEPKLQDAQGNIWMRAQFNENGAYRTIVARPQADKSYAIEPIDDFQVTGSHERSVYPEENDIVWYSGSDGLVRHDLNYSKKVTKKEQALIRKVTVLGDSVIFGGVPNNSAVTVLPFSNQAMRFEFTTPTFSRSKELIYSYKLEGFDNDWSGWTSETQKDYTNLPGGDYIFYVKSKDIRQQESGVATYVFIVLPPWYQTWTAYLAYTLIIGCFIYGVVRVRSRQLKNEKKKLERTVAEKTSEIQQQAEKLRELDKIKSQFFANISHEFRTPLTLILGPLEEKLKREEGDYREFLLMHRNAKRLERLIDQLLDLSRIESGQLELHIIRDNITKHIKAFVSSFSSYADQQDIALDTDFSDDNELGYFDPDKLEKIVYNLLSNAFKFTPQGGKISVRTAIRGHRIYMKITDTGRGMTNEEASQIFNRFYRSQSSIKSEIEGLGIGLALTRELIILHGGEISVQSKPNQGSTFEFELPIGKEYYNKTKIEEVSTSLNSVSKIETEESVTNESLLEAEHMPLLLIVEDSNDLRGYMVNILNSHFHILEAADGKEGFRKAIQKIPDLIISDLMMPKMDGLELCQQLKQHEVTSHIPVVLLTAKANIESRLEGLSIGADDYLTKPFNAEELQIRASNLITQRQKLRDRYSRTVVLKPKDIAITPMDEAFLEKIMTVVENNLSNTDFKVEEFQKEIGLSRMQLHRKIKSLTGHSTTEFMRHQRLIRAAELLANHAGNVSDICYAVGFNSLPYFTKSFKEVYGVTPSDYTKGAENN